MKFRAILIDDEPLALARLQRLLQPYTQEIDIIGQARNGQEGRDMVDALQPDVIFLDIEMPVLTGFEMLAQLAYMPAVVFTTAFDTYAIRAFEENSIDYLLKPIEAERLEITMQKLRDRVQTGKEFSSEIAELLAKIQPTKTKELTSIAVKLGDRILLVRLPDINYFEAEDKYVYLYTQEGKKHLLDYSLTTLEEKLPTYFARISRSVIVNTQQIQEIQKYFTGKFTIILQNKTKLISGSSYTERVRQLFEL
jgi:two-component system LytT family response regulator